MPRVDQGLGHDPHRVREIHDPGGGRGPRGARDRRDPGRAVRCAEPSPGRPLRSSPGRWCRTGGGVSRRRDGACCPPTRSCTSTKSAPSTASSGFVVSRRSPSQSSRRSMRPASPPTTARRSSLTSCSTSSRIGRRSRRAARPSMSSGVYVLPPPMTATFMSMWLARVLTIAYNVMSRTGQYRTRPLRASMARFQLERGPIPLHHQVFRDLRAALDAQEWATGRAHAHRARAGGPLRLQPDHRPPRPWRAGARRPHRADSWARDLRPATAHRTGHRRPDELRRGDAASRSGSRDAGGHRRRSSPPARRLPPSSG